MPDWRKNYSRYKSFFLNIYRVYKNRNDVKIFLEIILSLATISFFAAFALRPTALTITQLLEDIRAKTETVNNLDTKIENLILAQNAFGAESTRLGLLDQAVPSIPNPEIFARQVQGLSSRHLVNLNSLVLDDIVLVGAPKQKEAGELKNLPDGSGEVRFVLSLVGNYENLVRFLVELENMRQPVVIDNSSISVAQIQGGSILAMSINGRIPYLEKN